MKKIKYEGTEKICNKFALYAASVQVSQFSFFYTGGVIGTKLSEMKPTNACFFVNIDSKCKNFTIENAPAMNEAKSSHGIVLFNDYIYVVGGFDKINSKVLSSC